MSSKKELEICDPSAEVKKSSKDKVEKVDKVQSSKKVKKDKKSKKDKKKKKSAQSDEEEKKKSAREKKRQWAPKKFKNNDWFYENLHYIVNHNGIKIPEINAVKAGEYMGKPYLHVG